MTKDLTQLKKQEEFLWLQDASSSALQQSLKNLEAAFNKLSAFSIQLSANNYGFKSPTIS